MKRGLSGLMATALIIFTAFLGCMGAALLNELFEYRLPSGEWQTVDLGQTKAAHLLGVSADQRGLYIQTTQNETYSCSGQGGAVFGWFTFKCVPAAAPQAWWTPYADQRYTPPQSPGEVSESFVGPGAYAGLCAGQTNFVILKDGTLWSWSKVGCCEVGCLVNLVYPLGGMILGGVIGIVIVVVLRRRRIVHPETVRASTPQIPEKQG